jgi:hypothetical protein
MNPPGAASPVAIADPPPRLGTLAGYVEKATADMTPEGAQRIFHTFVASRGLLNKTKRKDPVGRADEMCLTLHWLKKLQLTEDQLAAASPDSALFAAGWKADFNQPRARSGAQQTIGEFIAALDFAIPGGEVLRLAKDLDAHETETSTAGSIGAAGLRRHAASIRKAPLLRRANYDPGAARSFAMIDATSVEFLCAVAKTLAPEGQPGELSDLLTSDDPATDAAISGATEALLKAVAQATAAMEAKKAQIEKDTEDDASDLNFTDLLPTTKTHLVETFMGEGGAVDNSGVVQLLEKKRGSRQLAFLCVEALREVKRMRAEQEDTRAFLDGSEAGGVTPLLTDAESAEFDAGLERAMDEAAGGPPVEVAAAQRHPMGPMPATDAETAEFDARLRRIMEEAQGGPPVEVVLAQGSSMGPLQVTPPPSS